MPHLSDSERAQQQKIYIPHPWNCCDNPKAIHPDRTYFSLFRSLSLSHSVCYGRAFRAQLFVDVFLASLSSSRKRTRTQQIASIMQMCVLGAAAAAAAVERVAAVRLCVATAASHTHTRARTHVRRPMSASEHPRGTGGVGSFVCARTLLRSVIATTREATPQLCVTQAVNISRWLRVAGWLVGSSHRWLLIRANTRTCRAPGLKRVCFSESVTGANIAVQVGRFFFVLLLCEINNRSADGAGVAGIARRLAFKLNDSRLAKPVCVCAWVCGCDMRARTHAHMGARCLWLNKCEKIQSFGKGEGGCSVYGEGMALV